ncbi:hypothetical protein L6164_016181 [Bauhinia variegata]|uniref:Uncharacterized protein n=1 Tax=Bauhinia variegata TaxID=167791 RepID=A0ACB9NQR6_BAUVA|nr:hypothetical protein L6164_016181 [Bauhinia variegata]
MEGPATTVNSCNLATPTRRNVRRRLVQSTLLPHKPQEDEDKDAKNDRDCREDEQEEEAEEDCLASEREKKRKSRGKVTPRTKGSKQRDKQQPKSTPKKRSSANGLKGPSPRKLMGDFAQIDLSVPNLRLEAKLSAEESSRMFAGRQIHPFFSSWKVGKKIQDPAHSQRCSCRAERNDGRITCGPVHVFENTQDDATSLDWRNWTFLEEATNSNCGPESVVSYLYEDSVQFLNFDNFHSILKPPCTSVAQNAKAVLKVDEVDIFSVQADNRKSDTEPQGRFLQESLRSYYYIHEDKPVGSLWIDKYKPTRAIEVCGNDESVHVLGDWLHLWHEKCYQRRRDSSHGDRSNLQYANNDYNYTDSDSDSEYLNEEDTLQNVLLITGPTGSGKTAAVYACAQEQGFQVLELNASDCRNGIAVKQYFGDTFGSCGFKRLWEYTVDSHKKIAKLPPTSASPGGKAADNMNDSVTEIIPLSNDEAHSPVEDVDIIFPEDRGCIAAIQQIAETAKGPIILTSNGNNPHLLDNLDRLHVCFSLPSLKELLCHLHMICVAERVNAHPLLLEKFVQFCDRDIRKTIMHLHFWFLGERFIKDKKDHTIYGSLPFDLEAGHQILTKIIPWEFPSQLSELIDKEVTESVTMMEENSSLQGLVAEEIDISERQDDLDAQHMDTDYLEAKKVEMLKRNGSVIDYSQFEHQLIADSEFSNSSGNPVASSQRKVKRKLEVMSSDSEYKALNNGNYQDMCNDTNKVTPKDNNGCLSEFPQNLNFSSPSSHKLVCYAWEDSEEEPCKYLETAVDTGLNETCKSIEAVINNGIDTMSGAVSSGRVTGSLEVSVNNESIPFTFNVCGPLTKLPQNPGLLVNAEIPGSSQGEAMQDFPDENVETKPVYNLMDEFSRVDFKLKSNFVESSPLTETDMVQKFWRKLRDCCTDLRQHATSEQPVAFQVTKLAYGMIHLMSEADLLFHNHQQKQCDNLEPPVFLSDEATVSWYDEQMMMSAVAVHGSCFYAKHITDVGSQSGNENKVGLTSEMLASTTNFMALGKLSRQDLEKSTSFYAGKESEENKPRNDTQTRFEIKTRLLSVIQSIVPTRLSLTLKGIAFSEYLSSLRQISRSEALRLSRSPAKTRRRRVRGAQHYLSSGRMALSPQDISLLSEVSFTEYSS